MMFRVGQKVVCVDDREGEMGWKIFSGILALKAVYTVRGFSEYEGSVGLYLEEIFGMIQLRSQLEYSFRISRFRPLLARKTDIRIFHDILRSVSQTELA